MIHVTVEAGFYTGFIAGVLASQLAVIVAMVCIKPRKPK